MASEALPAFLEPDFLKKLEQLRVVAKRLSWSVGKGEHPSARRGSSLEFSDYRRYHRGDDLRYVDWNIYRRLDRLLLKIFTGEEELSIYILVDVSCSMAEGSPAKIDYAKSVAAALGYIGLKNHDKVGAGCFSSDLESHLPLGRGKKQILSLFHYLENLSCGGETDLHASARTFALRFPRRGLVVLVSDLFDPRGCRAGLEELLKGKYEVLVVHLLDPADLRLEQRGNVTLLDVEGERERNLFIDGELARRFHEELDHYLDETAGFCLGHEMDYFRTMTTTPFEDFVLLYLRQGKKVR
ncbi:MAG: DUF58 domain-containing protein [Candidatus Binatia bacterium]|jgi:uncharacterized protein (DUF58 family)|nr:DUF58 domain-containing protein [Candidatus Binatia bacterium]